MDHANNEKRKETNNGRKWTAKLGKNQNAQRKENQQVLGNIGNRRHQTSGDERKKF